MDQMDNLRERVEALEDHSRRVERRLRWWRGIACSAVMLGLSSWALPSSTAQTQEYSGSQAKRLAELEYKLRYVTDGVNEIVITGANLRIVNGLGTTETTNGLGNLIVGYNESRDTVDCLQILEVGCEDIRTGSHNVIVGSLHNFSSIGGLVVGTLNEISGRFASVSGGTENVASGIFSSVSGGVRNTASAGAASVSGGDFNEADGTSSSVSGGQQNRAAGGGSSVSGGRFNFACGDGASVSGGTLNRADGGLSSVSGGRGRTAPEVFNWAAGPLFADN